MPVKRAARFSTLFMFAALPGALFACSFYGFYGFYLLIQDSYYMLLLNWRQIDPRLF